MINIIPVAYSVTYIFGTAGSAWVLSSLGPKMLGGLEKVKAACKELETRMVTSEADEPGFEQARRPVVFRAYRIENDWFGNEMCIRDSCMRLLTKNTCPLRLISKLIASVIISSLKVCTSV